MLKSDDRVPRSTVTPNSEAVMGTSRLTAQELRSAGSGLGVALAEFREPVRAELMGVVRRYVSGDGLLTRLTAMVTDADMSDNRLFGLAVYGAQQPQPTPARLRSAIPVAVVSAFWWLGAEGLDDLVDSDFNAPASEIRMRVAASLSSGAVSLATLPVLYLCDVPDIPAELRLAWTHDYATSCLAAASGQVADVGQLVDISDPFAAVLSTYALKTGAAYVRDAAMTARLTCMSDPPGESDRNYVAEWARFGQLFGILKQLQNDSAGLHCDDPEDIAQGTTTLLVAAAWVSSDESGRRRLRTLLDAAPTDHRARADVLSILRSPPAVAAFRSQVGRIHGSACRLLDKIAHLNEYRDALRADIDIAAQIALHVS